MSEQPTDKQPVITQHEKYELRVQCPHCKEFMWVLLEKAVKKDE